ncbi:hypothetical protein AHiyo6_24290, partial [Arthrobacter sp. Hiyo6]
MAHEPCHIVPDLAGDFLVEG